MTYAYDDDNRLSTVTHGTAITTYTYDPAGNLLTTTLPNGVVRTVTYDNAARIATLSSAKGASPIDGYTYTRDAAGNPTQIVATGTNVAGTRVFTYDAVSRLADVCYTTGVCPAAQKTSWTYNQVGSRLTQNDAGVSSTYTYDNADQLTTITGAGAQSFTYDANGNQLTAGTRVSTFNAAMQTVSIKDGANPVTTFAYDGNSNRVSATNGAVVTKWQWDRNNGLPLMAVERGTANKVQRRWINGLEPISITTPTATSYYLTDELGSVTHLTNATTGAVQWAYTYTPYGTDKTATQVDATIPAQPLKYTGQYNDPTGLYHLRARQYNPAIGAFTQTDPTPMGPGSPFEAAYVYGGSRPGVFKDPNGMRRMVAGFSFRNESQSVPIVGASALPLELLAVACPRTTSAHERFECRLWSYWRDAEGRFDEFVSTAASDLSGLTGLGSIIRRPRRAEPRLPVLGESGWRGELLDGDNSPARHFFGFFAVALFRGEAAAGFALE